MLFSRPEHIDQKHLEIQLIQDAYVYVIEKRTPYSIFEKFGCLYWSKDFVRPKYSQEFLFS